MKEPDAVPHTAGDAAQLRADAITLLSAVRATLADLLRAAMAGETGHVKEIAAKQGELESALRRAFEAEQKFNDWAEREQGRAVPGAIDLDAIRAEIGCRLHRLRSCCTDDGVS